MATGKDGQRRSAKTIARAARRSLEALERRCLLSTQVELVADINTQTGDSSPTEIVDLNGIALFQATVPGVGTELYRSDGTSAGTYLVKDINPGAVNSIPQGLVALNNRVYFTATTAAEGAEPWVSDGSAAGTYMLADIIPGTTGAASTFRFAAMNGYVYFIGRDASGLYNLYRTDGTAAGTNLVYTAASGTSFASDLYTVNSPGGTRLLFNGNTSATGTELWVSDGTTAGTSMLADIYTGATGSFPSQQVVLNGTLYFFATTSAAGTELWKSDGSAVGTSMVVDLRAGTGSGANNYLRSANGYLWYNGTSDGSVYTLIRSDGTAAGTAAINRTATGSFVVQPGPVWPVSGGVVFWVNTTGTDQQLLKTDGTITGTAQLSDIDPIFNTGAAPYVGAGNGVVYWGGEGSNNPNWFSGQIWRTDGTTSGTTLLKTLDTSNLLRPINYAKVGGKVFFQAATVAAGLELWATDGTSAGTNLICDLNNVTLSSNPYVLATTDDGRVYFSPTTGAATGVWVYDPSSGTTTKVTGIPSTLAVGRTLASWVNGKLIFWASDSTYGSEMRAYNETTHITSLLVDAYAGTSGSLCYNIVRSGNYVYFDAWDGTQTGYGTKLYRTDGTAAGTISLGITPSNGGTTPTGFLAAGNMLYLRAKTATSTNEEIWQTDGTLAGTRRLTTMGTDVGTYTQALGNLTAFNGQVYFTARTASVGTEVFRIDGSSPSGAVAATNVDPGYSGGTISNLAAAGSLLYFNTSSKLYSTDGTIAGTQEIAGYGLGTADQFTDVGGRLSFEWYSTMSVRKLEMVDGTTVRELGSYYASGGDIGIACMTPYYDATVGQWYVFYGAYDAAYYRVWHRSDGTTAGACPVAATPIYSGDSNIESRAVRSGNWAYFAAPDASAGTELFRLSLGSAMPAAPIVRFGISPSVSEQSHTLTATMSGGITLVEWDIDYDGTTFVADQTGAIVDLGLRDGPTTCRVAVRVTGPGGSAMADAVVQYNNTPPTLIIRRTVGTGAYIGKGQPYQLNLSATDPGPDTISSWTVNWGDGTIVTYPGASVDVSHTYTTKTTYSIQYSATDEDGTYYTTSSIQVIDPPTASAGGPYTVNEGTSLTLTGTATSGAYSFTALEWDLDYDGVTFAADATSTTSPFKVTFPATADGPLTRTVAFRATDPAGQVVMSTTTVTVNNVTPTITLNGAATVMAGTPYALGLTISDPGTDTISSCSIDWGDGGVDTFASFPASATHTYADGRFWRTITLTATDEDGTYTQTKRIMVDGINEPPSVTSLSLSKPTVNEGQPTTLSGVIADPDTVGGHTINIDWGDGTAATNLNLGEGTLTFSSAHTYADNAEGTTQSDYTITVTVTDDGPNSGQASITVTVADVAPTISAYTGGGGWEGGTARLYASASDPGGDTFTLRWTLTDSGNHVIYQSSAARSNANNRYDVSCVIGDDGVYTATIEATDADGLTSRSTFTLVFTNVAPTLTATGPTVLFNHDPYTLSLSSSDPGQDTIQYWTINWGDGAIDHVVGNPSSVQHTYNTTGPVFITASATDEDGTYSVPWPSQQVAIDSTFGSSGFAVVANAYVTAASMGIATDAVAVQPDGKILVAVYDTTGKPLRICRYNTNGTLDATFGTSGIVTTAPISNETPQAIAILADGRFLVLAGSYVVRFNANGSVDTSFGILGVIAVQDSAYDLKALPDGRFLICGADSSDAMVVRRYTASGAADATFGDLGKASVRVGVGVSNWDCGYSLALQPDGKVVVAGRFGLQSTSDRVMGMARFLSNGQIDSSFGTAGTVSNTFTGTMTTGESVVVMPDGRIVVAGYTTYGGTRWFTARYTSSGVLDPSFSADGYDLVSTNYSNAHPHDVMVQPDGKVIVAGGLYVVGQGTNLGFVRYNADGTYDTTFDYDGIYVAANWTSTFEEAMATAVLPDGNFAVLGGYNSDVRLLRLTVPNPLRVNIFSSAPGFTISGNATVAAGVTYSLNVSVSNPASLAIYSYLVDWGDGTSNTFVSLPAPITHVFTDGTHRRQIRVTVNSEMGATTSDPFPVLVTGINEAPTIQSVSVTPASVTEGAQVVLAGTISDPDTADTHTVQIDWGDGNVGSLGMGEGATDFTTSHVYLNNPAGKPVGSYTVTVNVRDAALWASPRVLSVQVANGAPVANAGPDKVLQEGQSVTLVGTWSDPGVNDIVTRSWLVRNPAGQVIASSSNDSVTCAFPDNGVYVGYYTATDNDGGTSTDTVLINVADVAPMLSATGPLRINEGQPYVLTLSSSDPGTDTISSWTINWGDGKIETFPGNPSSVQHTYANGPNVYAITGTATDEDGTYPVLLGASDGALDGSFGTAGTKVVDAGGAYDWVRVIVPLPDGRFMVAGDGKNNHTQIARFLADGTLDTSFGNGLLCIEGAGSDGDMVVQPDGKVVVSADSFDSATQSSGCGVFRFTSDGIADTSFGTNGKTFIPMNSDNWQAMLVQQSDGKFVVAWQAFTAGSGWSLAVARLNSDGSLDASFGTAGEAQFTYGADSIMMQDMAMQQDGKIVLGGYYGNPGDTGDRLFMFMRLDASGALDATFGSDGRVIVPDDGVFGGHEVTALAIDGGGRIVAAGLAGHSCVMRLLADGSFDPSFGTAGRAYASSNVLGLAVDSAGRYVAVAGLTVQRFLSSGQLDNTFGAAGAVTISVVGESPSLTVIGVQADGKLLVGGSVGPRNTNSNWLFARLDLGGMAIAVDNVAPVITLPGSAYVPTATVLRVSGTFADPGADSWSATVDYGDGSGVQALSLGADKTFALEHAYVAAGQYHVIVNVSDGSGSGQWTMTVHVSDSSTWQPVITGISDDTGIGTADGVTSDRQLLVRGTALAGAPVNVYLNGVVIGTTTADGSGSWSLDYTGVMLPDGAYEFGAATMGQTDLYVARSFHVIVDTQAPLVPAAPRLQPASDTGIAGDNLTADNTPTLNLSGFDGYYMLYLDGVAVASYGTSTVWTPGAPLADGVHLFRLTSIDAAGNESAPATLSVTIDAIAPTAFGVVNAGAAQRSMVYQLDLAFDEDVSLAPDALRLAYRSGATVADVDVNVTELDPRHYHITFARAAVQNGSLADGSFKLVVSAAGVQDLAGNAITDTYRLKFHRLFGDVNGDRVVNRSDLALMRQAMTSGTYDSALDFNSDGVLDRSDYLQLRRRVRQLLL